MHWIVDLLPVYYEAALGGSYTRSTYWWKGMANTKIEDERQWFGCSRVLYAL